MALFVTVSQAAAAMFGQPTNFIITATNTAADAIAVSSVSVAVVGGDGKPTTAVNVSPPTFPPGASNSITGSSGTLVMPFSAAFFGSGVAGQASTPNNRFFLTATVTAGTLTTTSETIFVALASPVWGAPPNPTVTIQSLQFTSPYNSGNGLLIGLV